MCLIKKIYKKFINSVYTVYKLLIILPRYSQITFVFFCKNTTGKYLPLPRLKPQKSPQKRVYKTG